VRAGSPLRRGIRDAIPLLGAQAVTFGLGLGLSAALLALLPLEDLGRFGRLREALRWVCVLGLLGIPTGLLRLGAEQRARRGILLATAWIGAVTLSIVIAVALFVLPSGLRGLLLSDPVAEEEFLVFVWKAPFLAVFVVAISSLHAAGRLKARGFLESGERVAVFAMSVLGAATGGLSGLVVGSLLGSALAAAIAVPAALRPIPHGDRRLRPDRACFRDLLRVGWPRTQVQMLEALRPLLLLQVIAFRADTPPVATGLLYGGMLFALPLIAIPERVAQAFFPTLFDERGEAADLDRRRRRLTLELAAVGIPLLALIGGAASLLLPMFRGGEYAGSVPVLWLLLPGVAAHGLAAHQGYVILARDRLKQEAVVSAVVLVLMFTLAWILVPGLGARGAAGALSAALVVRAVLISIVAGRPPARDGAAPDPIE